MVADMSANWGESLGKNMVLCQAVSLPRQVRALLKNVQTSLPCLGIRHAKGQFVGLSTQQTPLQ